MCVLINKINKRNKRKHNTTHSSGWCPEDMRYTMEWRVPSSPAILLPSRHSNTSPVNGAASNDSEPHLAKGDHCRNGEPPKPKLGKACILSLLLALLGLLTGLGYDRYDMV